MDVWLGDELTDGVGLAVGDGVDVGDGVAEDGSGVGVALTEGRGVAGRCVATTPCGGVAVAGRWVVGTAVAVASVATGVAVAADGVAAPVVVASGVPVAPSTAPAGRSDVADGVDDVGTASRCVAPKPTITAPITPATAAPAHRIDAVPRRAACGASREAGRMARPRSIARSASSAATWRMHSPQTDACSAASRGGSPGVPSASQVQKV